MSPAFISSLVGFRKSIPFATCCLAQFSKSHAPAVLGLLNFISSPSIASLTNQHIKAAHQGQPLSASSQVAALYSSTLGPQFVPSTSETPISSS